MSLTADMETLWEAVEKERFHNYLLTFLHIPYIWGGFTPLVGLDCSGLTQLALDYLFIDPPGDQTAHGLYLHFLKSENGVKADKPELGTLLFFGAAEKMTHVAIALDDRRMIEAGGGGSKTLTRKDAEKLGACVKISRINRRSDLKAMLTPVKLPWKLANT